MAKVTATWQCSIAIYVILPAFLVTEKCMMSHVVSRVTLVTQNFNHIKMMTHHEAQTAVTWPVWLFYTSRWSDLPTDDMDE